MDSQNENKERETVYIYESCRDRRQQTCHDQCISPDHLYTRNEKIFQFLFLFHFVCLHIFARFPTVQKVVILQNFHFWREDNRLKMDCFQTEEGRDDPNHF